MSYILLCRYIFIPPCYGPQNYNYLYIKTYGLYIATIKKCFTFLYPGYFEIYYKYDYIFQYIPDFVFLWGGGLNVFYISTK